MRFAYLYLGCAVLFFAVSQCVLSPVIGGLFIWAGLSFLVVSIGYFFNKPGIFRKKDNGRIPILYKLLYTPFFAFISAYNKLARTYDRVPSIQKIEENLYIGDKITGSDIPRLSRHKIRAVLDMTAEFESIDWLWSEEKINYLNIPVLDHSTPRFEELRRAVIWIKNQQMQHGNVLVNCALGRGRSALVIAVHLLHMTNGKTIPEVVAALKSIRKTVNLNSSQLKFLHAIYNSEQLYPLPRAWIIANPVSGGGKWQDYKEQIIEHLDDRYVLTIKETSHEISAAELAKQAIEKEADTIIACGGDGTVSQTAQEIVGTDIELGIIPAGTTNALCHVLMGIKAKILPVETACALIAEGKSHKIDTALCNGKLVLLLAGIGFEQKMIEAADRDTKNEYGQLAYLRGFWHAVEQNEELELSVAIDDAPPVTITTPSLVVANAAPLTTILAQGKGTPDHQDGLLDVTWIDSQNSQTGSLMGLFELALSGTLNIPSEFSVKHLHAKHIKITSDPPVRYVIDGEVFTPENLEIKVQPRSLRVFH